MIGTTRRRTVAGLSAATLTLVLAGCGGSEPGDASGDGGDGGDGGGPISVLLVDQPAIKELQSTVIPAYAEEAGIEVQVEVIPESGLDAKLATLLGSSQTQYDVIMTGAKNWPALVSAGALAPLDEHLAESDAEYVDGFPDTLLENMQADGQLYAMPYQVGAELLFYNTEIFAEAGLAPENPPTTVDEMVEAARAVDEKTDKVGFVGRGSREGNENSFLWLMLWFLNGGRWPTGGAATEAASYTVLTEDPAITTTEQYYTLLREYGPDGVANAGFVEAQAAMQAGQAAMWLDAAQLGPSLEDPASSDIAGKVGYAALSGTGGEDYIVGAIWGFSVAEGTENPDEAWALVQHLTGKETGIEQVVSGTNGSPGREDVLASPEAKEALNPAFAEALGEAIAHTNPDYTPLIPQGQQIRGELALELSDGLSSTTDAATSMKRVEAQVQGLLE